MKLDNIDLVITVFNEELCLAKTKIDKKGCGVILEQKEIGNLFVKAYNGKEFNAGGKRYKINIEEIDNNKLSQIECNASSLEKINKEHVKNVLMENVNPEIKLTLRNEKYVLDMHGDYQEYKKLFKSSNRINELVKHCFIKSCVGENTANHKAIYGKTRYGMSQPLTYFLENSKEK